MRIAFDLRYVSDRFMGIGRFAMGIVSGLIGEGADDWIDMLWDPSGRTTYDIDAWRRDPRVRWVETASPPFSLFDPFRLGALLRTLRPDVYLSPFWRAPLLGRVPLVLTIHDVLPFRHPELFERRKLLAMELTIRWLAQRARWLTVSEWSRSEIIACTPIPAARVHVVRTYEQPPRTDDRMRRPEGVPDSPFALVVGVNKPHKNLPVLSQVWERPGIAERLRLVWAGPLDTRYPALGPGRDGSIRALGRVSDAELGWLYRHASMFLFPTTYEGFGVPLLEAMSAGVPCVVSDIPPLREVGGGGARFVPPHDVAAWSAAIEEVLDDPELRRRLVDAGRLRAQELEGGADIETLRRVLAEVAAGSR